jgi:pyruvate dehydrogenase (quinone)/pyruvate oxidase
VGLVGDSRRTLQMLLPMLEKKSDRSFLEKAQSGMKEWSTLMEARGTARTTPMKPQVIAYEIGRRLPNDAIVSSDSGTITTWWARHIPSKRGQKHSCSGNLATMACGLPYAMAAAVAYPDRPSFAFVGDGGLSMLMAELATCVKYQLNIKIIVIKNNTLGQIKWEQMVFLGNPEYGVDLQPIDFALVARACGVQSVTIEDSATCGAQLDLALRTPGPVLIQAVVDALEPPQPAKVTLKQAEHFAQSLLRGEPNGAKIALTVISDRVREMV